jgi:multiple sugar transport system substrate-binding protein
LTVDSDSDGQTDQFGLGTDPVFIRLAPFIWQNGGELTNPDSTQLALDTPQALEAAHFFVDLQVKHHVVPNAVEEESEDSQSRFENGSLAMFLQSRRPTPTFREVAAFDWDVAELPRKGEAASILHSDGYCRPAAAQHPELAWKLIEFANSPDGQVLVAATGRSVPSLKSVAESPAFLDPNVKPANSQVWLDAMAHMHVLPLLADWGEIEEITGEELQRAYYGDADVEEAMQSAIDRTRQYFAP